MNSWLIKSQSKMQPKLTKTPAVEINGGLIFCQSFIGS